MKKVYGYFDATKRIKIYPSKTRFAWCSNFPEGGVVIVDHEGVDIIGRKMYSVYGHELHKFGVEAFCRDTTYNFMADAVEEI